MTSRFAKVWHSIVGREREVIRELRAENAFLKNGLLLALRHAAEVVAETRKIVAAAPKPEPASEFSDSATNALR